MCDGKHITSRPKPHPEPLLYIYSKKSNETRLASIVDDQQNIPSITPRPRTQSISRFYNWLLDWSRGIVTECTQLVHCNGPYPPGAWP